MKPQTAILLALILLMISGCGVQAKRDFERAQVEAEAKNFRIALSGFEKLIKRYGREEYGIKAAREASRIAFYEIKDYKRSIEFFRHLVMYSVDPGERRQSQMIIADIYFDHLNDYQKSITEYNRILEMPHSHSEQVEIRMKVARAYYHMNNFFQAESEVDEMLRSTIDDDQKFDCLMLKANIYLGMKDLGRAATIFKTVLTSFPKRAAQENVALTLAVAYEEQGDFAAAIGTLESMRPTYSPPEYLDLRIKRLKERQKNAPGARGLRK